MRIKDVKWLDLCAGSSGMYPGIQCDVVPSSVSRRLNSDGLIELFMPHNGAHKDRWKLTPAGRAALAKQKDRTNG